MWTTLNAKLLFEASLVAEAVLRGELSLDDPVNKYVNELRGAYIRRVTIGELATHTSGLLLPTDHPPWPDDSYSLAQFLNMLNTWTPQNGEQPGKRRIYTHAGYVLLQLALERRYGTSIGALIESRILEPLGMNSTLLPERGPDNQAVMAPQFIRRTVQGYSADGMPIGAPGNQQSYFDFPGTGQMFSSARDLAILVAATVGDQESVDPQTGKALQFTQHEFFRVGQAMAWEVNDLAGPTIVDKPGGLNNASAYVGLLPERKLGLVILSNRGDIHRTTRRAPRFYRHWPNCRQSRPNSERRLSTAAPSPVPSCAATAAARWRKNRCARATSSDCPTTKDRRPARRARRQTRAVRRDRTRR